MRTVITDLDLDLPLGQVSVIAGPGGSGKTTLLRAVGDWQDESFWWRGDTGLLPAWSLSAQWQGVPPEEASLASLIVPGDPAVRENPSGEADVVRSVVEKVWGQEPAAEALLEALGRSDAEIPSWLRRLARLTGSLSRATAIRVLDEPCVDLPEEAVGWVVSRLRKHCAWGRTEADTEPSPPKSETTIIVTHNLAFARSVADFMVLMIDSALIETGEATAFFSEPRHPRTRHFVRFGG